MPGYTRLIPIAFQTNRLSWASAVISIPLIGPYYRTKLAGAPWNAYTVLQLLQHYVALAAGAGTVAHKTEAIRADLSVLTRNARSLTCTPDGYLVRPVNRMAFNVIADLLAYARERAVIDAAQLPPNINQLPPNVHYRLICQTNEMTHAPNYVGVHAAGNNGTAPLCHNTPDRGNVEGGDALEMQRCPCFRTANTCNGANLGVAGAGCMWVPAQPGANPGPGCVPANARSDRGRGAPGVGGEAGSWNYKNLPTAGRPYVDFPPGSGPGRDGTSVIVPPVQAARGRGGAGRGGVGRGGVGRGGAGRGGAVRGGPRRSGRLAGRGAP